MAGDVTAGSNLANYVRFVGAATATFPEDGTTEQELLAAIERRIERAEQPKTKIMVIDDESKIRTFLKEMLEMQEYEVFTAASGPEALEQLQTRKVALVLLDVAMPVMNGYETYHLLKENPNTKDVPVIIVTGQGERKDRQLGMGGAAYNYVEKPFQVEELLSKVRGVLQQQQSMHP